MGGAGEYLDCSRGDIKLGGGDDGYESNFPLKLVVTWALISFSGKPRQQRLPDTVKSENKKGTGTINQPMVSTKANLALVRPMMILDRLCWLCRVSVAKFEPRNDRQDRCFAHKGSRRGRMSLYRRPKTHQY